MPLAAATLPGGHTTIPLQFAHELAAERSHLSAKIAFIVSGRELGAVPLLSSARTLR